MLFHKSLQKGKFYKELFIGNYTNTIKEENEFSQILAISESNLEVYDYTYDERLKIPCLELNYSQELYFHVLDCKVNIFINHQIRLLHR